MWKTNKKFLAIFLAVAVFASVGLTACAQPEAKEPESAENVGQQLINYKTTQVVLGDFEETFTGNIGGYYPIRESITWEGGDAYFQEVDISQGQRVKKGDVLMTLRLEDRNVELETQKLQLRRMEENFAEEKTNRLKAIEDAHSAAQLLESYDREIALLKAEKLQVEYERYVDQTQKSIDQTREKIQIIEQEQQTSTVVAPFDGYVNKLTTYSIGDKVTTGKELLVLVNTEILKMTVSKTETGSYLRYNMPITFQYGDKNMTARLTSGSNILPDSMQPYALILEPEVQSVTAYNEKFTAQLQDIKGVPIVDRKAVFTENGETYVKILDGDMVRKRPVVVKTNSSANAWVLCGLEVGDLVIIE